MSMQKGYLKDQHGYGVPKIHFHNPPQDKTIVWFLAGYQKLSFKERIKLLCKSYLHVCFYSIDGKCNAACGLVYDLRK